MRNQSTQFNLQPDYCNLVADCTCIKDKKDEKCLEKNATQKGCYIEFPTTCNETDTTPKVKGMWSKEEACSNKYGKNTVSYIGQQNITNFSCI